MNAASLAGHVVELLKSSESTSQPLDRAAGTFFRERTYLGARDRRFISEHVFGIVRHRRLIEALLERMVEEIPDSADLDDRNLRHVALYVIYSAVVVHPEKSSEKLQSAIPSSYWSIHFPKISLSHVLEWTQKNRGLEFLPHDDVIRLGVKYSFQDWMVKEWKEQLGGEVETLLNALNLPASVALRVNTLRGTREDCQIRLRTEGIETHPTPLSPDGLFAEKRFTANALKSFKEGWFEFQDEGSQLVSLAADPQEGTIVIDGCAGTGGKSLHLAGIMLGRGKVIAMDVDERRLQELDRRAKRAGLNSIKTVYSKTIQREDLIGKADLVLVDAPCSGVGTIRRNPSLKWSVSESLVRHHADRQLSLLQHHAPYVASGGRMVYVTCSLLRTENEEVMKKFLQSDIGLHFEFDRNAGASMPLLPFQEGCCLLYPHRSGTDGFFIVCLKRVVSLPDSS